MPKFYIYERVPEYREYRKIIEAESLEAALALAPSYSEFDVEQQELDGELIENMEILYDAEPVEA